MSNAIAAVSRPPIPRPTPRASSAPTSQVVPKSAPVARSSPPPLPARARKAPTSNRAELVPALFERLHALAFFDDPIEGARFCLRSLATLIPCRAAIFHLYDVKHQNFVVVDACGSAAADVGVTRTSVDDPLFRVAIPTGIPLAWGEPPQPNGAPLARFAALGSVRTVLVGPIASAAFRLGAIELVDPMCGEFSVEHEHAVQYVAESYARFLVERFDVLDTVAGLHQTIPPVSAR